jgi:cytochrome c
MHRMSWAIGLGGFAIASQMLAGCEYNKADEPAAVAFTDPAVQIAHGAEVFTNSCASCHGDAGQGTRKGPALVGEGVLTKVAPAGSDRKSEFHTAMDIAVFATQNMPPNEKNRSQIAERDYWAVLAFALSANGVDLNEPVGPDNAAAIVINP